MDVLGIHEIKLYEYMCRKLPRIVDHIEQLLNLDEIQKWLPPERSGQGFLFNHSHLLIGILIPILRYTRGKGYGQWVLSARWRLISTNSKPPKALLGTDF